MHSQLVPVSGWGYDTVMSPPMSLHHHIWTTMPPHPPVLEGVWSHRELGEGERDLLGSVCHRMVSTAHPLVRVWQTSRVLQGAARPSHRTHATLLAQREPALHTMKSFTCSKHMYVTKYPGHFENRENNLTLPYHKKGFSPLPSSLPEVVCTGIAN